MIEHCALNWLQGIWASPLGDAIKLFLCLRILFSVMAVVTSSLMPALEPCATGARAPVLHTSGLNFQLFGLWQRWDSCWYERIATNNYPPNDAAVNFFPLYPLLIRLTSTLLYINLTFAGLIVSAVAYIAAIVGVYALVTRDFDKRLAEQTALYLSIFPTAFFFFGNYSAFTSVDEG